MVALCMVAASVGALVLSASPASAACGTAAPPDLDSRAYTTAFDGTYVNIRTGPHTSCTSVGQGQLNHVVDYHCYARGDGVTRPGVGTYYSWTYLRDVTTGKAGWVSDTLLDSVNQVRGSNVEC